MTLPASFFKTPITHRGLHDRANGRLENSLASFEAAIAKGYGIELDLQLSSDGEAIVFHDYELSRLTHDSGPVALKSAKELGQISLRDDPGSIPTLAQVLQLVDGQVPLLIEIKDQDGAMGPNVGRLEKATAQALAQYEGDAAVMSFNPHAVAHMKNLASDLPRGLVTAAYDAESWPTVPAGTRDRLRDIPDYERLAACFVSHEAADLGRTRVAELKSSGSAILCWTIRSPESEAEARKIADNVTFEGYLA